MTLIPVKGTALQQPIGTKKGDDVQVGEVRARYRRQTTKLRRKGKGGVQSGEEGEAVSHEEGESGKEGFQLFKLKILRRCRAEPK